MLCVLIMAGGRGTRFWPLSTEDKPKQFLNLIGEETMIQMTVNRVKPLIPVERIFVCTGEKYVSLVKSQLPELPERNIIIEPQGRNTAPCIALSAIIIQRYYKDANMVVLPADHLIKYEGKFRKLLSKGEEFINLKKEAILTLGMEPSRPETGYGYIRYAEDVYNSDNITVKKVDKFVEKPNMEKAKEYLAEGNYLWNGGMFLWNCKNITEQIKKYSPMTYEALHSLSEVDEKDVQAYINKNYRDTEATSIDYAVLEKSNDVYVIPSDLGWDDIGNWEAIERYREKDPFGNILMGDATVDKEGEDNLIVASNSEVIIDGLNGIYVIENDGKIIVGKKNNLSNIKELKELIKEVNTK